MTTQIICLLILILTTLGCKREDPNPENSDPIYQDLLSETRKTEQEVTEAEKKVEEAEKTLEKTEPRTIDRKNAEKELENARKSLQKATQMLEYYKIHSELRRIEGRKAYKIYFQKGKDWPPKGEAEAYELNKKLRNASKNWGDRVPKQKNQFTAPPIDEGGSVEENKPAEE